MKRLLCVGVLLVMTGCVDQASVKPSEAYSADISSGENMVLYVFGAKGQQGYFVEFPREPASESGVQPRLIYQD